MKLRIEVEGKSYDVDVEFLHAGGPASRNGHEGAIDIPPSVTQERPPQKLLEDAFCRSPIAGRIVAVVASVGQKVRKNEPVLVIEAMKMEIKIGPAVDGVVKTIHVKAGQSVGSGQMLFELS